MDTDPDLSVDEMDSPRDDELSQSLPNATKKKGVLGKLSRMFGKSKRNRSRSNDPASMSIKNDQTRSTTELSDTIGAQTHAGSSNTMSMSADSIFTNEEASPDERTPNIEEIRRSALSMEALVANPFKGELERKLFNRRSMEDDGLGTSPIGTPTTADVLNHPNFMAQRNNHKSSHSSPRTDRGTDRDSDGSLLSIGSSENDDDFQKPWRIGAALRGVPSSDSESDVDTLDLDAVIKTDSLSHNAAMHKRNVRPKRKQTARRGAGASRPNVMPSVEEKNVLEIAHTFLDSPQAKPSATRKVETRPLDPVDKGDNSGSPKVGKSPKPVARSHTSASPATRRQSPPLVQPKSYSLDRNLNSTELMSVFSRLKPTGSGPEVNAEPTNTELRGESSRPELGGSRVSRAELYPEVRPPSPARPPPNDSDDDESPALSDAKPSPPEIRPLPPYRERSAVGFKDTEPPPYRKKITPPVAAPRPKSMYSGAPPTKPVEVRQSNERSKTVEAKPTQIEDSSTAVGHSRTLSGAKINGVAQDPVTLRNPKQTEPAVSQPSWVKLAQRKTLAVATELDPEPPAPVQTAPKPAVRPSIKQPQGPPIPLRPTRPKTTMETTSAELDKDQSTKPSFMRKKSPDSQANGDISNEAQKEVVVLPKLRHTPSTGKSTPSTNSAPSTGSSTTSTNSEGSAPSPWKAALRQRPASMKVPTPPTLNPSVSNKPSWKSATVRDKPSNQNSSLSRSTTEPTSPSSQSTNHSSAFSKSSEYMDDRFISTKLKAASPSAAEKTGNAAEQPASVRDILRRFQS